MWYEHVYDVVGTCIYNPRQKSWHACPLFAASLWEMYQFIPHPPFNVVYRDEFVIARFQHCLGGRGVAIPVMSLQIVCKIACQHIFMLSDSGVPRTFVWDCRWYENGWYEKTLVGKTRLPLKLNPQNAILNPRKSKIEARASKLVS